MKIEIPKSTKGAMGHLLDMREAVAGICESARLWDLAFKAGDMDRMTQLFKLMGEHSHDIAASAAGMQQGTKEA